MSVLQGNGVRRGYKFVYRVYKQEKGFDPEIVCTVNSPEEAGFMIEEAMEEFGEGYLFYWKRHKELTVEAADENHD